MFDSKISSNLINVKQEEEKCLKRESTNDEEAIKVYYWNTIIICFKRHFTNEQKHVVGIIEQLLKNEDIIWPVNAVAGHFRQNFQRFQTGIQSHR